MTAGTLNHPDEKMTANQKLKSRIFPLIPLNLPLFIHRLVVGASCPRRADPGGSISAELGRE